FSTVLTVSRRAYRQLSGKSICSYDSATDDSAGPRIPPPTCPPPYFPKRQRQTRRLDTGRFLCYPLCVREQLLKNVSRIVVKLGTGVLTDSRKQLDPAQMQHLVEQIAAQRQAGKELLLVTSGAVGAGMGALGHAKRPVQLAELQACAAVGQTRLMAT